MIGSMCSWRSRTPHFDGGLVGVVGEGVPGAEDDVVEVGQRHEVLDQRHAVVGALAEADRAHLGQRADGLAGAAPGVLDAGDEGRRDGAEADEQDAEPAGCGRDLLRLGSGKVFGFQNHTSLTREGHRGPCHCAGMRPVLAQCSIVL